MIDACRTAAKNSEIALKAQNTARISQWIAFGAMLAAWGAIAVSLILGGTSDRSWNISTGATGGTRDWTDLVAVVAVLIALASVCIARRQLTYQALVELTRDYSQEDMAHAVSELWSFWRRCGKSEKEVARSFGEGLREEGKQKSDELQHLNLYRRRVSHFYQRMAGLYVMAVLPGHILYSHWREADLEIIPKIIIPMEEALTRYYGEEPGNELDRLRILYRESDIDGIRRTWRRLRRRLSSMASTVHGSFTRKPQVTQ